MNRRTFLRGAAATAAIAAAPKPAAAAAGDPDRYDIVLTHEGFGERFWVAPYERTLAPGVGWTDGDRNGYRCAYGHLLWDTVPVGRFTFIAVPDAATYASVKDRYMDEGSRYYDGTVVPEGAPKELRDCPEVTVDYEPFDGDVRPTIRFRNRTFGTLETRHYKNIPDLLSGVTFQQTERSNKRIGVVSYYQGRPIYAIYYDSLVRYVNLTSDLP